MSELFSFIERLKAIPRIENSFDEISSVLSKCLDTIEVMLHNLHPTYRMARIRVNNAVASFDSVKDLSYKPKELNDTYQRASIPFKTMLYTSSCERRTTFFEPYTDDDFGIKIALFETIPELRQNCLSGKGAINSTDTDLHFRIMVDPFETKRVTYSIWEVIDTISLVRVSPTIAINKESWGSQIVQNYIFDKSLIKNNTYKYEVRRFYEYLSFEFSRIGSLLPDQYHYMISAICADTFCKNSNFDGISFSSARCDGYGINFAIKPSIVDDNMKCVEVGELEISSVDRQLVLNYLSKVKLNGSENSFAFAQ